jgi:signal transduction histidine kinase/ligand-binding sensor domain-containing protein
MNRWLLSGCLPVFFLLLPFNSQAQQAFRKFKVTHWDSRTGMPNDISLNIYQSRDGFIWLSGYSGLIRFDGAGFTIFNSGTDTVFKSDGITSIVAQTPDSALWIPTPGSGLLRYKNGRFTALLKQETGLSLQAIVDDSLLMIGRGPTVSKISLFNYRRYTRVDLDNELRDSALAVWRIKDRINWLTVFPAMRRFLSGNIRVNGIDHPLFYDSSLSSLNSVLLDRKGRVWTGTQLGISVTEKGIRRPAPGLENETIIPSGLNRSMILEDNEGGIWIGTRNGVAYLPDGDSRFTFYQGGGTIKLNNVQAMLKDSEGNIWTATDKGLFKFSPSRVLNYTEQDGLVNSRISSITETSPGRFILSTRDNALYSFAGDTIRPLSQDIQEFINTKREIFYLYTDRKKQLWVASNGAIFMIGNNTRKSWRLNNQVRYIHEGRDGRIYAAVSGMGIGYIDAQDSLRYLPFPGIDFKTFFISTVRQRANGDWVMTTYSSGIMIGKAGSPPRVYKTINGVGGIQSFGSYEDSAGHLWFCTAKGLAVIRQGRDSLEVIDNKDGMPYPSIFEVLEDQLGFFWMPSNLGVIKASRAELLRHLDNRSVPIAWKVLDEGDGLVNQQFVGARHSIIGSDKRLYFPNISGLVVIDPGMLKPNTVKPKLAINGMMVDNQFYGTDTTIVVQPGDHRYIISYSALSFLAPDKVQIKFRLIGYDRDWIISQGDRRAIYTNLPPGEHVFEMIAANNDGVWADEPVRLVFTIKPFFYQTNWFRILAALTAIGLVWLFVRWRTSATRRHNQELEALVSKRTEQISKQKTEIEDTLHQLKATQAQLIQSEKMASLGELTAGIAHEIQNPLNFVNNFAELNAELVDELQEAADLGKLDEVKTIASDIKSNQEKIAEHGKRADGIVKGMLQHSRANTGQKEQTDINALCDEYLRLAYHGIRAKDKAFNASIQTHFDPQLPMAYVVAQDIGRVILNLLNNAYYAVNVRSQQGEPGYQPGVEIRTEHAGNLVKIIVRDNGNGIAESIRDKIFQPFFTTKPTGQGTGLGLSLSYDIVKAHGGELRADSTAGKGTSFVIILPLNG